MNELVWPRHFTLSLLYPLRQHKCLILHKDLERFLVRNQAPIAPTENTNNDPDSDSSSKKKKKVANLPYLNSLATSDSAGQVTSPALSLCVPYAERSHLVPRKLKRTQQRGVILSLSLPRGNFQHIVIEVCPEILAHAGVPLRTTTRSQQLV